MLLVLGAHWSTAHALDLSERDKQYHFAAGFVFGIAASSISYDQSPRWSPWAHFALGVGVASGVGLAKEGIDKISHEPESDDALATALGGAIGAGLCLPYQFTVGKDTVAFSVSRSW